MRLTRTQAARRIGVSVSTIRRMEGVELEPIIIDGRHLFELDEVDRARPKTEGQIAARAFEGFKAGRDVVDMVIELEQPPEVIEGLHEAWRRLTSSKTIQGIGNWSIAAKLKPLGPLTPYRLQQALLVIAEDPGLVDQFITRVTTKSV